VAPTRTSAVGLWTLNRIVLKSTKWWAVLFLPILLRALIPVGFMPMFGPGFSVRMVICDGYTPLPKASTSMSTDMPMDMPMDGPRSSDTHGGAPTHHQDPSNCPYGCAPALGALPTLASLPLSFVLQSISTIEAQAQIAHCEVSPRAQSPRGPPA
jgi:hypothetical protein